jgi:hypothetical protein
VIRRLLVLVVAAIGAWWLMRRLANGVAVAEAARRPAVPRFEGAMVRDRICQTFLPKHRALTVREGDEEHFFCSDACRSAYLSRRRAAR